MKNKDADTDLPLKGPGGGPTPDGGVVTDES